VGIGYQSASPLKLKTNMGDVSIALQSQGSTESSNCAVLQRTGLLPGDSAGLLLGDKPSHMTTFHGNSWQADVNKTRKL
jgi:hypothetical protein